jgi:hypothetical protein
MEEGPTRTATIVMIVLILVLIVCITTVMACAIQREKSIRKAERDGYMFTMGPLLTGDESKKVYIATTHSIFAPVVDLVHMWVRNAGHVVVPASEVCDVQIAFYIVDYDFLDPLVVPTVLIASEQPEFYNHNHDIILAAHSIWCMDVVDLEFYRDVYGVKSDKLFILPAMAGTYIEQHPVPRAPKTIDVLHFGMFSPRRAKIIQQLKAVVPKVNVFHTNSAWGEQLLQLLNSCHVVVVPNSHREPNMFPLHRIMNVMQYPGVRVVVEESLRSKYSTMILKQFGDRIVIARYEDLTYLAATMAKTMAKAKATCDVTTPEPPFIKKLHAWDGKTSWLKTLS